MTNYYIAPATHPTTPGNDTTGNGSSGTPWATISKAHTSASSGDTVICKDGTYAWASQTFSKSLTIAAENNGLAIFDGAGASFTWTFGNITISMTGIIFQNASQTSAAGYIFASGNAQVVASFTRCKFLDLSIAGAVNFSGGVFLIGQNTSSSAWSFVSCLIDDPVKNATASAPIFLSIDPSGDDVVSLTMRNCIIYLSTTGGTAINYLILANYPGRVVLSLINNIIYNGTAVTIPVTLTINGGSYSPTANNNAFYDFSSVPSGTGNITDDPLFYDVASGNFNLRPTSPALNTGTLI